MTSSYLAALSVGDGADVLLLEVGVPEAPGQKWVGKIRIMINLRSKFYRVDRVVMEFFYYIKVESSSYQLSSKAPTYSNGNGPPSLKTNVEQSIFHDHTRNPVLQKIKD